MKKQIVAAAGALLVSASAIAQAGPVAEKSSDQIVCELTGDCAKETGTATADKPESRGFSIAKRGPAQSTTSTAPQSVQRTTTQRMAPASARAPSGGNTARFSVAPRNVGRADLSINFVSGSASLTDSGRRQAQAFGEALRAPQLTGKRFVIGGHTDSVGSRAYNLDLSKRRAQAVVDFLAAQGASRTQFEVQGHGFDKPLPGLGAKSPANRRVEVVKLN